MYGIPGRVPGNTRPGGGYSSDLAGEGEGDLLGKAVMYFHNTWSLTMTRSFGREYSKVKYTGPIASTLAKAFTPVERR